MHWSHRLALASDSASSVNLQQTNVSTVSCLQESVFVELAKRLLKKHLPPTFDLTLLNVGVTSFADLSAPSGVCKISSLFPGKPPRGAAEPGHACDRALEDTLVAGAAAGDGAGGHDGQADGLQLISARRDYHGADGRAVVSKRKERALLDAQLPPPRHSTPPPAVPACRSSPVTVRPGGVARVVTRH